MDRKKLEKIKNNLVWNFNFKDEFKTQGYTFIIDVYQQATCLSLYRFSQYGCKSESLTQQPPKEMLDTALVEQGNETMRDGLYYINDSLQQWIENNILKTV